MTEIASRVSDRKRLTEPCEPPGLTRILDCLTEFELRVLAIRFYARFPALFEESVLELWAERPSQASDGAA